MKPPFLEALSFSEEDFSGRAKLLELRIHVTRSCNMMCVYCLSSAPYLPSTHLGGKMAPSDYDRILDEAAGLGVRTVSITGSGEPTLYPALRGMVEKIRTRGFSCVLFSNGLELDDSLIDFLDRHEVNLMIKLNSFDDAVNSALTGVQGATDRVMGAIRKLVDRGFATRRRLAINCVICRDNARDVPEVFRFCRRNGIIPWIERVTITGRARPEIELQEPQLERLYLRLSEIDRQEFGFEWEPDSPIVGADRRRYAFVCQVDVDGYLYHTDARITRCVGTVFESSIADLISSDAFLGLQRSDKHSNRFVAASPRPA